MPEHHAPTTTGHTERPRHEAGQALSEYAIVLMCISIVAVVILTGIGMSVLSLYTHAATTFPTP